MFVFIMWIRIKTTQSFATFLHSGLRAGVAGAEGE
jgi:hypothetical protein